MKSRVTFSALVLVALFVSACDEVSSVDPMFSEVAGSYSASGSFGAVTFQSVGAGGEGAVVDWLAAGATVDLRLEADGRVSGSVFLPKADEDGSDFSARLDGAWSSVGGEIRLEHEADTFLRDMSFRFDGTSLSAQDTFDGVRVTMVLLRM